MPKKIRNKLGIQVNRKPADTEKLRQKEMLKETDRRKKALRKIKKQEKKPRFSRKDQAVAKTANALLKVFASRGYVLHIEGLIADGMKYRLTRDRNDSAALEIDAQLVRDIATKADRLMKLANRLDTHANDSIYRLGEKEKAAYKKHLNNG